ncbi:MAG: hypothetical protein N4A49_10825 [Marinifilaceae bacterium]|nr:hypothetical protein [Marinifilaceae bacterium]
MEIIISLQSITKYRLPEEDLLIILDRQFFLHLKITSLSISSFDRIKQLYTTSKFPNSQLISEIQNRPPDSEVRAEGSNLKPVHRLNTIE